MSEANLPVSEMPKSSTPPLLPEQKLERVVRIARADSMGVMICSGLSLVLALPQQEWHFAGFAALAFGCGYMEWHGHDRLRHGGSGGLQWLLGAQACLYTVIVAYALWRWRTFDAAALWSRLPPEAQELVNLRMKEAGWDPEADRELLLRLHTALTSIVLVVVSTLYQCGLALWYRAQQAAIFAALGNPSTRGGPED